MHPTPKSPVRREGSSDRDLSLTPLCLGALFLIGVCFITEESDADQNAPILSPPTYPRKFFVDNFWPNLVNHKVSSTVLLANGTEVVENTTVSSLQAPDTTIFVPIFSSETIFSIHLGSLFLLWYLCNVYFNIFNKQVLKVYPYPFAVTALQFGVGGIVVILLWGLGLYTMPAVTFQSLLAITPVAIAHALGNLFTNMSVREVAVSFTHVVKSMEPFFSVGLSGLVFHKIPSFLVILSLVPIVSGVALASVTEVSFNWSGFLSAMASNLTFQSRNVLSKQLMLENLKIDNINLFAIVTLMSFVVMIPVAVFKEQAAFRAESYTPENFDWNKTGSRALLAALCFHSYQQVSYMILQRVTPVTHAVGNCMKRVIVIVSSVVFFKTPVSRTNAAGIAFALLGVFIYSQVKLVKFKGR